MEGTAQGQSLRRNFYPSKTLFRSQETLGKKNHWWLEGTMSLTLVARGKKYPAYSSGQNAIITDR